MKKILIIIPAYNEEENILKTVTSIREYCLATEKQYDVLVINDGSKDCTGQICEDNSINVIHLVHNLGIGGAVQTGYKYAYQNDYDIAIQFDGDGQHEASEIDNLIQPILNKESDFVIGSRFIDKNASDFKSSSARRAGIKLISFFIKLTTGKKVFDTTSGFRAVDKEIIKDFSMSYPTEYPEPITTAELLRKKYILAEVPSKMHERDGGVSSIRAWKNIYYMINVILTILVIRIRRYNRVK